VDIFAFFIRHTPFWAIPLLFICLEFGNMYRLKKSMGAAKLFFSTAIICMGFLIYYYWAGGPEKSVDKMFNAVEELKQ
jgi:hypothetical protein